MVTIPTNVDSGIIINLSIEEVITRRGGIVNSATSENEKNNSETQVNAEESDGYDDKHEEYFFKGYNEAYDVVSNNVSRGKRSFKKLEYYTKSNNKYPEDNKGKSPEELCPWTLDSGATYHMTGNLRCLSNIRKHNRKIYFPNGDCVRSKFKGDYIGYINKQKIILKDVLYVPIFKRNLISVDGLSDQHYKTVFHKRLNKNRVTIYDRRNKKVCSTFANNSRTYVIWT